MSKQALENLLIVFGIFCTASPSDAQQVINSNNGSVFMEETNQNGQEIKTEDGSIFMEEVSEKQKPRRKAEPTQSIDYSSLGVPVDPKGRIVPLIQPGSGPVLQNFSRMELEYTPPAVYIPYYNFLPYGYAPAFTPWGTYGIPLYRPQYMGAFAVPLGIPRYFSSSSDSPESQQFDYQFGGKYVNGFPSGSIWNPGWQSPWGGNLWLPQTTQFQSQGSIRSFFPRKLSQ